MQEREASTASAIGFQPTGDKSVQREDKWVQSQSMQDRVPEYPTRTGRDPAQSSHVASEALLNTVV